jgi:uncharacterized membrane protein YeaQ/YmgE (transglycosylase-associated protein family)
MDIVVYLIVIAVAGLFVGALARLALPGPDPMSIWATIGIGVAGSLLAGSSRTRSGAATSAG